jgi:predicted permease
VLAGLVILMYNSLSAVVLAVYSPDLKSDPWSICKSIFSNPLIISVLVATPMAYGQVPLPNWLLTRRLPGADDPAAGADLHWWHLSLAALRDSGRLAIDASLVKMVWLPLLGTLGAWLCGFRGRAGHPVPVHRQPDRRGQLCDGASGQRQP